MSRIPLVATPFKMRNGILIPKTRAELAEHDKLSRYATLTFGMYAWLPGQAHDVKHAGSGVMIAPGLALGAKHVSKAMIGLDERYDSANPPKGDFHPAYGTSAFQAPRDGHPILFGVTGTWTSPDTDIAVMTVVPDTPMAKWSAEYAFPPAFVEWQLEPPPVGAQVELYGYPNTALVNDGKGHSGPVTWVQQTATVTDIFEPMRTHGHLDFPCYRLDRPVDKGFSGGPVFYEGRLVGITSVSLALQEGDDSERDTYVASLWPLLLMEFEIKGQKFRFQDRFDYGTIRTVDHPDFRAKVYRKTCDMCSMRDPDHKGHAERV
jgi:hypothetical protein